VKITDIQIVPFRWKVDRYRAAQVLPQTEVMQTILKIVTDEGVEGYYFGGGSHGDEEGLPEHARSFILNRVKPMLVGQDPLDREKFWKWLWVMNAPEHVTGVVDMALWDLAGRQAGQPVHKLLGGARDKIKAYASTYPNMARQRTTPSTPWPASATGTWRTRSTRTTSGTRPPARPSRAAPPTSSGISASAGSSARPSATTWC